MASVFDLFGTLNLETRAFENSVRSVASKLNATDKALDQTIAKSNKLGDTSATVARRYEKLGESINAQRQRLLANSLAFEKGEINAKKFASVVTSVDNAIAGMNSRIKDANARLTELGETNLTHFQQQIKGAMGAQSTDLFKQLSGYQKTQLSFQLNDIISGLAMGQNPLQILAQQGGQIVQIFQMSKVAQEGTAVATAAAAASEAAFVASADAAAVAQGKVAVSSQATAAAMTEASAATTIFGASLVSIGATLAAGLVAILSTWKASKDILTAAEKRLKNEEKITAELNKQALAISNFKQRLANEAGEREFNRFLQSDDIVGLQMARDRIQRERDAVVNARGDAQRRAESLYNVLPGVGLRYMNAAKETAEQEKVRLAQEDQISALTARIAELQQSGIPNSVDFYTGIQKRQMEAFAAANKTVAQEQKDALAEAVKKAKEFADHIRGAQKAVTDIFSSAGSSNPFVRIFSEGQRAVERMLEATRGLGKSLQASLGGMITGQFASQAYGQTLDNALQVLSLRSDARQFRNGALSTASVSDRLAQQLRSIGAGTSPFNTRDYAYANGVIGQLIRPADSPNQEQLDRRIIALTQGLNPADLTDSQNRAAASAREREAGRIDRQREDAKKLIERQNEILDALDKSINSGTLIHIKNDAPDNARVTRGSAATTASRYQ